MVTSSFQGGVLTRLVSRFAEGKNEKIGKDLLGEKKGNKKKTLRKKEA